MNYQEMIKAGIPLLPCVPETKLPMRKKGSFTVEGEFKGWCRTEAEMQSERPTTCWAVNPGNGGWMVLDIDTKTGKDGLNNLKIFLEAMGEPGDLIDQLQNKTFPAMVVTPSGGLHAYFKYNGEKRYRKAHLAKHFKDVELFHGVGYIIAPGSFIKGYGSEHYVFHGDMSKAPDAPAWLIQRFEENEKSREFNALIKKRYRGRRFNAKLVWADLEKKRELGGIDGMNMQLFLFGSAANEGNADIEETEAFLIEQGIEIAHPKISHALRYLYSGGVEEEEQENPFSAIEDIDLSELSEEERKKIIKKKEAYEKKKEAKEQKSAEESQKAAERETRFRKLVGIYKKSMQNWRYVEKQKLFADLERRTILLDKENMDDRFSSDVKDCTGEEKTFTYMFRYYPEIVKKVDNTSYWPGQDEVFEDGGQTLLNTWEPTRLEPKDGDVSWFINHLKYIYDNNMEYVENFINWAAHIVQNPSETCVWNPWIQSAVEGTGKSMIASVMQKLVGEANSTVVTATDIASDYNGWAANKLVIIEEMDEAKAWGTLADKLKHYSTSAKIRINDKYVRPYDAHNSLQFMLLSNKEVPMKVTGDARRWFIHKMQGDIETAEYYEMVGKHIEEDTGCVLKFLLNRDLKSHKFNPKRLLIETEAKEELIQASKSDQHKKVERETLRIMSTKLAKGEDPLFIVFDDVLPSINTGYKNENVSETFAGSILSNMRDDKKALIFSRERIKIKGVPQTVYFFGMTKEIYTAAASDDYTAEQREANRKRIRDEVREKLTPEENEGFISETTNSKVIPMDKYFLPGGLREKYEAQTVEDGIPG